MIKLPEIIEYRLISLAWIDEKDEFHKNIVCAVADCEEELSFNNEFDNKGWLYNSILETNNIDIDKVHNLRLVGETLPFVTM